MCEDIVVYHGEKNCGVIEKLYPSWAWLSDIGLLFHKQLMPVLTLTFSFLTEFTVKLFISDFHFTQHHDTHIICKDGHFSKSIDSIG